MSHVFISYARKDGESFAHRLYEHLSKNGFPSWIDRGGIMPSTVWDREIEKAIRDCEAFIFIMTQGSIASNNCADEWNLALNLDKPIFTLLMQPVEIPMRLLRIQYVDFTMQPETTAFSVLLQSLGENLVRPEPEIILPSFSESRSCSIANFRRTLLSK